MSDEIQVEVAPVIEIKLSELTRADKILQLKLMNDSSTINTGDNKVIFMIPEELNSYSLTKAHAYVTTVSSSGVVTVQLRRKSDDTNLLSTPITIDANEYTSYTAATQPVVNSSNDVIGTGELLCVDIDTAGTGAKGLGICLSFQV